MAKQYVGQTEYSKDTNPVATIEMENGGVMKGELYEDIAPIMYIKLFLFGNNEYKNIKCVVIDEAQDFGLFSYFILRKLLPNAYFSIFGLKSFKSFGVILFIYKLYL